MAYGAVLTVLLAVACVPAALGARWGMVESLLGVTREFQIKALESAATDTVIPTGGSPGKDSPGDTLTFHNNLFCLDGCGHGWDTHHQIGHNLGSCTRIVAGESWHCSWTNFLKWGSITVNGPFYDAANSTLAITGGTGCFAQAKGSLILGHRDAKADGAVYFDFTFNVITGKLNHKEDICKTLPRPRPSSADSS